MVLVVPVNGVDGRAEIGKMKESPGAPHCERVGGIQTQEPDTWVLTVGDINPYVDFGKCRESWDRG